MTSKSRSQYEMYVEIPRRESSKRKSSTSELKTLVKKPKVEVESQNAQLYCHQCAKKRDAILVIQCTKSDKCKAKYCKSCMQNRYGKDVEILKSNTNASTRLAYSFECPRCEGICNCRGCRKAQGLEPTGNLTLAARKEGKSAAQLLDANPDQLGVLPGKGKQTVPEKKTKPQTSAPKLKPKPKKRIAKKLKPTLILSQPKWLPAPVPAEMSLDDLESRIFIREFMMRFLDIMDKDARSHLDELAEIAGDGNIEWTTDEEPQPLVSWVSEACIKSIFVGLLGLFVDCSTPTLKKSWITDALKGIKNSSANLTKIWVALATLRNHAPNFNIPDPLSPPSSLPVYNTRRGAVLDSNADGIQVGRSAQFVPVIIFLMEELLLVSKGLKADLDSGDSEIKDTVKQAREAIQRENERWKSVREQAGGKPSKDVQKAHKLALQDLEEAQRILMYSCAPRFGPLGTDDGGRSYYALSPGIAEREWATAVISGEKLKRSRKVVGGVVSLEEAQRESLTCWSWFLAIYGKKPEGAEVDDDDRDNGEKKWWGFWQADSIKELAHWIALKNGLDDEDEDQTDDEILVAAPSTASAHSDAASSVGDAAEDSPGTRDASPLTDPEDEDEDGDAAPPPSDKALKNLVSGLNNYASLLSSRVDRGERERQKDAEDSQGGSTRSRR